MEKEKQQIAINLGKQLELLESFKSTNVKDASSILKSIRDSEKILKAYGQLDSTLNNYDQVLGYCRGKLDFAKRQVKNGFIEEGLDFALIVLQYFLKQTEDDNPVKKVKAM